MNVMHKNSELNEYMELLNSDEMTDELIDCFDDFRREKQRQDKWDKRHMDSMDFLSAERKGLVISDQKDALDIVLHEELIEKLQDAFEVITQTQKKRIFMYFYDEMTFSEIAKREGVDYKAVWKSVDTGITNIKKYFDVFYE